MTSKVLKCNNCDIVISELLSCVQNKYEVMDEQSLTRILLSSFSNDEITEAKNLLFESVKTSKRKITRRKEGKTNRNLEDIMALFKEIDPEDLPIFVARDLQRLPPVCFDHVDVTKLLKDILLLQKELRCVKENYATVEEMKEVKSDLENLKATSIVNNFERNNYINTRRGGSNLISDNQCNSGPFGLIHIAQDENVLRVDDECEQLQRQRSTTDIQVKRVVAVVEQPDDAPCEPSQREEPNGRSANSVTLCDDNTNTIVAHPLQMEKSMARIVSEGEWKSEEPGEDWKLIQRKRLRNRFVGNKGQACVDVNEKFRAADTKIPMFINNVNKSTSAEDIAKYIFQKTNESVVPEKNYMKVNRNYDAYKIFVPRNKFSIFMDATLWPDGISFRRFVKLTRKDRTDDSNETK